MKNNFRRHYGFPPGWMQASAIKPPAAKEQIWNAGKKSNKKEKETKSICMYVPKNKIAK